MSHALIIDQHAAAANASINAIADDLHPPFRRYIPSRRRLFSVDEKNADHGWRPVVVKMRPVRKLLDQPGAKGLALRSASEFPTAGHWAIQVGKFTYELVVDDNGEAEFFFGEWLPPPPPDVELDCIKRIKVGNCNMSDEEIYGLALEVFDRMQITGKGYSQFSNNCQRYVRHLSSKLCAHSVTDWLATNFMFVTKAIPSSTLVKQSSWLAVRGLIACGIKASFTATFPQIKAYVASQSFPSLVVQGLAVAVPLTVGESLGILAFAPIIMLKNYQKLIGRKMRWTCSATHEEYIQVYGSRNVQLEAIEAVAAMILHGDKGKEFARRWFDMNRPDGLNAYHSILNIVSDYQASSTHEFIDWMKKVPQSIIENEGPALAAVAKRVESKMDELLTVENGIKVVNRSKEILKEKVTVKNAKKACQLAKSVGEHVIARQRSSQKAHKTSPSNDISRIPTPVSVFFSSARVEEVDEGYESAEPQQDDTCGLQAVIVRSKATEGNPEASGDVEDDGFREIIHIGDLDLLDEWFRLQNEDQMDRVQ